MRLKGLCFGILAVIAATGCPHRGMCGPCALPDLVPQMAGGNRSPVVKCTREKNNALLHVVVANKGAAAAASFAISVQLLQQGRQSETPPARVPAVTIKSLGAGDVNDRIQFALPYNCFQPTCAFIVVVDSANAIVESSKANNVVTGSCSI